MEMTVWKALSVDERKTLKWGLQKYVEGGNCTHLVQGKKQNGGLLQTPY
jgi:hypothetical protein